MIPLWFKTGGAALCWLVGTGTSCSCWKSNLLHSVQKPQPTTNLKNLVTTNHRQSLGTWVRRHRQNRRPPIFEDICTSPGTQRSSVLPESSYSSHSSQTCIRPMITWHSHHHEPVPAIQSTEPPSYTFALIRWMNCFFVIPVSFPAFSDLNVVQWRVCLHLPTRQLM